MSNEYLDLASLETEAEVIDEIEVESADYTNRETMPVGNYISRSRTITGRVKDDGNFVFQIEFTGGLSPEENPTRVLADRYPLRYWVSTTPFTRQGHPGKTSSAAEYLKAVGFNPKNMGVTELLEAIKESQTVPVQVFVGWTDKAKKLEDGSYSEPRKLRTSDFNIGTKQEPNYVPSIVKDGETFVAKPIVRSVRALVNG